MIDVICEEDLVGLPVEMQRVGRRLMKIKRWQFWKVGELLRLQAELQNFVEVKQK